LLPRSNFVRSFFSTRAFLREGPFFFAIVFPKNGFAQLHESRRTKEATTESGLGEPTFNRGKGLFLKISFF